MKVYRCWWCLDFLPSRGKDCKQVECIKGVEGKWPGRKSGAWRKHKKRNSVNKKEQVLLHCQ